MADVAGWFYFGCGALSHPPPVSDGMFLTHPHAPPHEWHRYSKKYLEFFTTHTMERNVGEPDNNPNMSLPFVLIFDGGEDSNEFVVLLHTLFNMSWKCIMEGNDQDMLNKVCNKTTNSLKSSSLSKISTKWKENLVICLLYAVLMLRSFRIKKKTPRSSLCVRIN